MTCVEARSSCPSSINVVPRPQLLVSVRNEVEAQAAIEGGADIIDVKEPAAGSLGRATTEAMRSVAEMVARSSTKTCSVALGELQEAADNAVRIAIPPGVRWLKMGLSRCRDTPDWQRTWVTVRETLRSTARWIAVAYVDSDVAWAPSVHDVLEAAISTRCAGLLLDTFSKSGGTLLDELPLKEIASITREAQAAGLLVALAGRVQTSDLPALVAIQPDVIAVRSAVCRNQNRTASVDRSLVAAFRQAMLDASVAPR